MARKNHRRREKLLADLEMLLGGGSAYGIHHAFPRIDDYWWRGPREKEVVIAGNKLSRYHYAERMRILQKLESGLPLTKGERAVLLKANDSFAQPAFAVVDELKRHGIKTRLVDTAPGLTGSEAGRIERIFGTDVKDRLVARRFDRQNRAMLDAARDPNVGVFMQVAGTNYPQEFAQAKNRGAYVTRLLTDYGDGAWNQPIWHSVPELPPNAGGPNGMAMVPGVKYDTVYVPGGGLRRWKNIPWSQHTVDTGGLATSPIFEKYTFKASEPGVVTPAAQKAKAILFTGGGSGLGMPFETGRYYGHLGGEKFGKSLLSDEKNILDYILAAMRKKHGSNFTLDFITGARPDEGIRNTWGWGNVKFTRDNIIDPKVVKDRGLWHSVPGQIQVLTELLDKDSPVRERVLRDPEGAEFIKALDRRYKGLRMVRRLELPGMAEAYRSADYLFGLPGSSLGEIASIKGNRHGGIIHLVPRQTPDYPRHFLGNALATNRIMQPHAKHNIVNIASNTLEQDLIKAVEEGGTKNWGRRSGWKVGREGLKPLVKDIIEHSRWSPKTALKHGGRIGALLGGLTLMGHGIHRRVNASRSSSRDSGIFKKKGSANVTSLLKKYANSAEGNNTARDVANMGALGTVLGGGAHAAILAPELARNIKAVRDLGFFPKVLTKELLKNYGKRVGKTGLIAGGSLAAMKLLLSLNKGKKSE